MISFISIVFGVIVLKASPVQANQVVYIPAPTWTEANGTKEDQRKLGMPLAYLEDQGFNTTSNFTEWQLDNGFQTLRNFVDNGNYSMTLGADQACGWTDPKGVPQQIPENSIMRTSGYTRDGPCEIWLDDTLTYSSVDCLVSLPNMAYTVDYSGCGANCIMYWHTLDVSKSDRVYSWEVYKECIPIYSNSTTREKPTSASDSPGTVKPVS
ncbi:unnamed protein product [Phytophthora fragariaefolia]|uniref:Unnamed protein product n=1 Tax=Phytophthora fragariaefolia TaxID=1490495 RepID=A0A9W7CN58_9STRA|nr:unnamed protein product [Phytophthora fragariaefolia]